MMALLSLLKNGQIAGLPSNKPLSTIDFFGRLTGSPIFQQALLCCMAVGDTREAGFGCSAPLPNIQQIVDFARYLMRELVVQGLTSGATCTNFIDGILSGALVLRLARWPPLKQTERWRLPLMEAQTYNVFCDESCHLEHDGIPVMAWGGIACPVGETRAVSDSMRNLKQHFELDRKFETKWTKVSPAKLEYYLALIDMFLADSRLMFRGLLVPDKSILDHEKFEQTHDEWYYKMYFNLLLPVIKYPNKYRVYLDVKDTIGGAKVQRLREVLSSKLWFYHYDCIERVQQVRSHECELLQLADLLVGALTYKNRGLETSFAKGAIVARLCKFLGENALSQTSAYEEGKFNLLRWQPQRKAAT